MSILISSVLFIAASVNGNPFLGSQNNNGNGNNNGNSAGGAPCNPNAVHDAMIVYGFDHQFGADPILIDNDIPTRNTLKFRQRAYQFFLQEYGLQFDPTDGNLFEQEALNVDDVVVKVQRVNPVYRYNVYAFNDPEGKLTTLNGQHLHRMPITNAYIDDVVYSVESRFSSDFNAPPITWTDPNGATLSLGFRNRIVYGSYRLVAEDLNGIPRELTDEETDIYYFSPGLFFDTGVIECVLESTLWGGGFGNPTGVALGNAAISQAQNGFLTTKNVMTFPISTTGTTDHTTQDGYKCQNLKPQANLPISPGAP